MTPVFPAYMTAMMRCYIGLFTGNPHITRAPLKEPPTFKSTGIKGEIAGRSATVLIVDDPFPRSDMVVAMEEERDGLSNIRPGNAEPQE